MTRARFVVALALDCGAPNGWTLRGALRFERGAVPETADDCDDDDDFYDWSADGP